MRFCTRALVDARLHCPHQSFTCSNVCRMYHVSTGEEVEVLAEYEGAEDDEAGSGMMEDEPAADEQQQQQDDAANGDAADAGDQS